MMAAVGAASGTSGDVGSRRRCGLRDVAARLLTTSLLIALTAPSLCRAAEFTRSFSGITEGTGLLLIWEEIPAEYMPLTVYAQLLNRTGDYNRANVFMRNLTSGLNGTSWLWQNMPSPLPYLSTGLYQVEVKPEFGLPSSSANATAQPQIFPKSPYFVVLDSNTVGSSGGGASNPTTATGGGGGGPNSKTVSMAVGLVVGLVLLLIACAVVWWWRRRYKRAKKRIQQQRLGKFDVVIY